MLFTRSTKGFFPSETSTSKKTELARIVLGVTGGIAAFKSAGLIRLFAEAGHEVKVVATKNATRFIGEITLEALSHNKVEVVDPDLFSDADTVKHVALGQSADLVVIAPATASFIARLAAGLADDLLTTTVLSTTAPVVIAPAMHTEMWLNQATVSNVEVLSDRGFTFVGPESGRLTGEDSGPGRMSEAGQVFDCALALLGPKLLSGKKVLVTAGGTREPIDGVRFLGNYSSGKQGLAFAKEAKRQGAEVMVIACNIEQSLIAPLDAIHVSTTAELSGALTEQSKDADLLVMSAAVADFRAKNLHTGKLHRSALAARTIDLIPNPDLLGELIKAAKEEKRKTVFVGFAAEVDPVNLEELAREKLASKGCDFIIANDVSDSKVFGSDYNNVIMVSDDSVLSIAGSKQKVAEECLSFIAAKIENI